MEEVIMKKQELTDEEFKAMLTSKAMLIAYSIVVILLVFLIFAVRQNRKLYNSDITKSEKIKTIQSNLVLMKAQNSLLVLGLDKQIDSLVILRAKKDSIIGIKVGQVAQLKNSFKSSTKEWVVLLEDKDSLLVCEGRVVESFRRANEQLEADLASIAGKVAHLIEKNDSLSKETEVIVPLQAKLKTHREFLDYVSKWDKNITKSFDAYAYNGKRGFLRKKVEPKKLIIN